MPFVSFLSDDAVMRDIIMGRPEQMGPFSQLVNVLLRGPSSFTEGERELIGAFVSSTNDCPFCVGTHAAAASHFDVPESTLQALASDFETAPVDERLKPVLRYVEKLTKTPYRMTQADADAVLAAGWDESALSDAILICALFNMANRVVDGHGVDRATPREKLEGQGQVLAEFGYRGPALGGGASTGGRG